MNSKKVISFMSLILLLFYINLSSEHYAAEMTVDVGIEFSENDPHAKPEPVIKLPPKKIIRLPQTGEQVSYKGLGIGLLICLVTVSFVVTRQREVTKK